MPRDMDELRRVVAELTGNDPKTWPNHGNASLAIAATVALLVRRAQQPATPAPIDTAQGREAELTLADVLCFQLTRFGYGNMMYGPHAREIASAVARARDRQVAEWLRQCRHESSSPMRAHEIDANVRLLADRIEAGAVDRP